MSQGRVQHRSPETPDPKRYASTTVISALAMAEGVEQTELDVTLYDVIDPDALDTIFEQSKSDGVIVTFSIDQYDVTVRGPDDVVLTPSERKDRGG